MLNAANDQLPVRLAAVDTTAAANENSVLPDHRRQFAAPQIAPRGPRADAGNWVFSTGDRTMHFSRQFGCGERQVHAVIFRHPIMGFSAIGNDSCAIGGNVIAFPRAETLAPEHYLV